MKNRTDRRKFLAQVGAAGLASAFITVPGACAQALVTTPEQTEGPYYPITLPLDTDNDLLVINSNIKGRALKDRIRSHSWFAAAGTVGEPVDLAALRSRLAEDDAALVAHIVLDGELTALAVTATDCSVVPLGPAEPRARAGRLRAHRLTPLNPPPTSR